MDDDLELNFINSGAKPKVKKPADRRGRRPGVSRGRHPKQLPPKPTAVGQRPARDTDAEPNRSVKEQALPSEKPTSKDAPNLSLEAAAGDEHATGSAAPAPRAKEVLPSSEIGRALDGAGKPGQKPGQQGKKRPVGTDGPSQRAPRGSDAKDGPGKPPKSARTDRGMDPLRAAPLPAIPKAADAADRSVFDEASTFSALPIDGRLARHIEEHMRLPHPTRVQARAVPRAVEGADLLLRAATGSGKTLAYLVPIVQGLVALAAKERITRDQGARSVVLTPTRELCFQTLEVAEALTRPFSWLVCGAVMGGEKRKSEKARLRKGVTVLVATPGRLEDHLSHTNSLRVDWVSSVVLDEADRCADLGIGGKLLGRGWA
mmetsp:Transcript_24116/g.81056  ORF Transcript_24116/g.81056 Transcript_24116/m.81056 type:complete len:374 (+) Transcript_24116:54-1175(+)